MIKIYKTANCPKCCLLAAHLTAIKQPFEEANLLDLLQNAEIMTELHLKGIAFRSAPVLQVGSSYFGHEWFFTSGKLDEMKLRELL